MKNRIIHRIPWSSGLMIASFTAMVAGGLVFIYVMFALLLMGGGR